VPSAVSLAASYRCEAVNMKNPLDIFEAFILAQEKNTKIFELVSIR
jgi:hypothetical protein